MMMMMMMMIQSPSENGFMEPKYDLRFVSVMKDILIIIWEYDWMDYYKNNDDVLSWLPAPP